MPGTTGETADLVWQDHFLDVPEDYTQPHGGLIQIYAREVVAAERRHDKLPWLLWLEGGPGNRALRPLSQSSWLKQMLRKYRVLLLDQRGTGRSSPITRQTIDPSISAADLVTKLMHYRADSIVRDAEVFRAELVGKHEPWTVLGQSFGGFCATTYLSFAPESLAGVMISGGLPPLVDSPDEVYRATYAQVLRNNERYWRQYPDDQATLRRIVDYLGQHETILPSGDRLSPERFQSIGISLGKSGSRDRLHYILEDAFIAGPTGFILSDLFLREVESEISYLEYPLYAVLHESIYCSGKASRWSAHRIRQEFSQFDLAQSGKVHLTGEMVYPWFFEQDSSLSPFREAAQLLAERDDWPKLYDQEQLQNNQVPVSAVIYHDDMYVDRKYSLRTAEVIRGSRIWVTDKYEHDGIWVDDEVSSRLLELLELLAK